MLSRGVLGRVVLMCVVRCCVKLCSVWVELGLVWFSWARVGDVVLVCVESC